jgi:hypothetical protein
MGKYTVRVVVVKFFFFLWEKTTPKGNTGSFFGQNISFFQKQVAKFQNFTLFCWERLSPQVFILATLFNGPVQNHRQLNANLLGETLYCCYTTKLGKQSTGVVCIFPPVLMTHVNLVGYLSILALCRMTVSLPHLIAL